MITNIDRLNDEHLNNLKRFMNARVQKSVFKRPTYIFPNNNHKIYRKK